MGCVTKISLVGLCELCNVCAIALGAAGAESAGQREHCVQAHRSGAGEAGLGRSQGNCFQETGVHQWRDVSSRGDSMKRIF